ncbi:hypothetical protein BH09BAC5_BH09BAC5_18860 [soil metagenome]
MKTIQSKRNLVLFLSILIFCCDCTIKKYEESKVYIYCYPIDTWTWIPITTSAIIDASKEKFELKNEKEIIIIDTILKHMVPTEDTVFQSGQVRVGVISKNYSAIYLDRASTILYEKKVYIYSSELNVHFMKLLPAGKAKKYLRIKN